MTQVPFVDLSANYRAIAAEIDEAMSQVLSHCDFVLGRAVSAFEKDFAAFVNTQHAIGVATGLDALRLSLMALGIGPGDEVVLPANTFIATALAVSEVGARPVLVDCDCDTFNLDPAQLDRATTSRTKALIAVHLTGQAADMDAILEVARRRGLPVIEDACQAHGATYKGRPCGSLGSLGCFSFYPGKNLGAYGDGGLITTNDAFLAEHLRCLRNYGQKVKYAHVLKGVNSRLDTLQAAVLGVKLKHLPAWNAARQQHAAKYRELLQGCGDITFQTSSTYSSHVYHLFVIRTAHRDGLQAHLNARGVQTGVHYPSPIHLQQAYQDLGYRQGDFPRAERLAAEMLSLPMYPELEDKQIAHVIESAQEFFARENPPIVDGSPHARAPGSS